MSKGNLITNLIRCAFFLLLFFVIWHLVFPKGALATCYCANPGSDQCKCSAPPPASATFSGNQDGVAVKCTSQEEANSTFERKNPICGSASETIPYCSTNIHDGTDVTCWGTEFNSGASNVPLETGNLISWNKPVDFNGFHVDKAEKIYTCKAGVFCCARQDTCSDGGVPRGSSCNPQDGPGNTKVCGSSSNTPPSSGIISTCSQVTDPEFHSLRPYRGSFCSTTAETVTTCGNDLILQKEYKLTPGAGRCTANGDGTLHCEYEIAGSSNVQISVPDGELPIAGNTQLVKNSINASNQIDDKTKTNEYVSWYLNGTTFRAEDLASNAAATFVDFAGPLKKLLPLSVIQQKQIESISKIKTERHDQIVACAQEVILNTFGKSTPHDCYSGNGSAAIKDVFRLSTWNGDLSIYNSVLDFAINAISNLLPFNIGSEELKTAIGKPWNKKIPPLESGTDMDDKPFTPLTYRKAYQEWNGKTCAIITFPVIKLQQLLCVDNPFVPNKYAELFPYVPLSSTEDLPGKISATGGVGLGSLPTASGSLANYDADIDQFLAAGASYYIAWQYSGNQAKPLANDQFSFYQDSPTCATLKAKAAQYPGRVGVNIYSLSNIPENEIREHLNYVKNNCGASIVRFWGFDSPDTVTKVLNVGKDIGGLKFIVALADFGIAQSDPTGWYTSGYKAGYQQHAQQVADGIKQAGLESTVYALELVNEPHCFGQDGQEDRPNCITPYVDWAHSMSALLSKDGLRIGIGQKASEDTTRGDSPGVGSPSDFEKSNNASGIGTTSGHYYNDAEKSKVLQALDIAKKLNKQFYIGEAGAGSSAPSLVTTQAAGISDVVFQATNNESVLFVPHLDETTQLSSFLQSTFAAKGVNTAGSTTSSQQPLIKPHCEIDNSRTNPGDDLLGEKSTPVQGKLNFKFKTSCDFGPAVLDQACYNECLTKGGTTTSCKTQCTSSSTCTRKAEVAMSVYTKIPKVNELWYRTVFGNMSIFKRIFPKDLTSNSQILDLPAVTKAKYESTSGDNVLAGDPKNNRPGGSAQIFIPHLGGVYDYFLKGIQTALRPKDLTSSVISGVTTPAKNINCNQAAPDPGAVPGLLSKDILIKEFKNEFTGNHIAECYNDVVAKAKAAGYDPAFAMAIWIEESGASDYNAFPNVSDFGCAVNTPKADFSAQLSCFLQLKASYSSSAYTACRPAGSLRMEDFLLIFSEGRQHACTPGDACYRKYCGNPGFPARINTYYSRVSGGKSLPATP